MNIFQDMGVFYGNADRTKAGDPLLAIFHLTKRIRLQLGRKGYLLDNYLDLVFQGFNRGDPSDAIEAGVQAAYSFQRLLLSYIVDGKEPETAHPLYGQIRKVYDQYSKIQTFQEERTRMYLLMALAGEDLLEYAISDFIAKQEKYSLGSDEIGALHELYDKISGLIGETLIDELNDRLRQRFQVSSMMSAFLQGYANDLLFQLTWRDPETSKQIFQLLLDVISEE